MSLARWDALAAILLAAPGAYAFIQVVRARLDLARAERSDNEAERTTFELSARGRVDIVRWSHWWILMPFGLGLGIKIVLALGSLLAG